MPLYACRNMHPHKHHADIKYGQKASEMQVTTSNSCEGKSLELEPPTAQKGKFPEVLTIKK